MARSRLFSPQMAPLIALLGAGAGLAAADAAKPTPYPLATCAVSGEALGSMGEAYAFVHEGREIKLCCKGCLKKFTADPATWLKQVDAAAAATPKGEAPAKAEAPAKDGQAGHGH